MRRHGRGAVIAAGHVYEMRSHAPALVVVPVAPSMVFPLARVLEREYMCTRPGQRGFRRSECTLFEDIGVR